jgi:hypothetical protein
MRSFGNHDWHAVLAFDVARELTQLLDEHKVRRYKSIAERMYFRGLNA